MDKLRARHRAMTDVQNRDGTIVASFVYAHEALAYILAHGAWNSAGLRRWTDQTFLANVGRYSAADVISWAEGKIEL